MIASGCVVSRHPVPDPTVRIFLLHHAGGSHLLFRPWQERFPADWEVCTVEAPGRGRLAGRPLCRSASAIVDVLLDEMPLWMDRPYAFFGHSMGALVAYELALALHERRLPLPAWIGLSARGAPRPDGGVTDRVPRHRMSTPELREALIAMGGTPRAVLEDPDLWSIVEGALRADLEVVETWRPRLDAPVLPVPISAFCGDSDVVLPPSAMDGWAARTTRFLGSHVLPGGHFYFQPDPAPVIERITADLLEGIGAMAGGHGCGIGP